MEGVPLLDKAGYRDEDSCKTKFWGCLTMCNTSVLLLLSLGMFVAGVVLWSVINGYFGIVDDIDYVICKSCVIFFTISTLILFIGSAVSILSILVLVCCFATNRRKFYSGMLISMFYTLAGVMAIITLIAEPIWLSRQSSIVQRFDDSSKVSFLKQQNDTNVSAIWDNYQKKFGCCGVCDYKDYYDYFGRNTSIPMSCCNLTTLEAAAIECSAIIKNVTEEAVSSYYIYGKGCSAVIIDKLNLNSTTIHDVGIAAAAGSVFVGVSVIMIFIFTMIIIPEDNEQRFFLAAAVLIVLCAIMKVFLSIKN